MPMYAREIAATLAAAVDGASTGLKIVDYPHHEIHSGSSFHVHYQEVTANSDDDRTCIGFTTPDTAKWAHLIVSVSATHPAIAYIYEAPNVDPDVGSQEAIRNRNRNSTKDSTMLSLETTPVAAKVTTFDETEIAGAHFSGGKVIDTVLLGGGRGSRVIGGTSRGSQEWMLKQNTTYVIVLENYGANVNYHNIGLDWYEHTDVS